MNINDLITIQHEIKADNVTSLILEYFKVDYIIRLYNPNKTLKDYEPQFKQYLKQKYEVKNETRNT